MDVDEVTSSQWIVNNPPKECENVTDYYGRFKINNGMKTKARDVKIEVMKLGFSCKKINGKMCYTRGDPEYDGVFSWIVKNSPAFGEDPYEKYEKSGGTILRGQLEACLTQRIPKAHT